MLFRLHVPAAPLDRHIESIVYYSGLVTPHSRERLIPEGVVHLCVDLTEPPRKRFQANNAGAVSEFCESWISGAHDRWMLIGAEAGSSMLVVTFRPGGAYPFLGFPADAISNSVVPLEDVFGQHARALRQRLLDAATPEDKLRSAEDWLVTRSGGLPDCQPAVAFLANRLLSGGRIAVGEAMQRTGYTERHMSGLFRRWVGLSPKSYQRLRRFAAVRREVASVGFDWRSGHQPLDWAGIAAVFGYADQSHLSRDFQQFSGLTPAAFAERATGIENYLPAD